MPAIARSRPWEARTVSCPDRICVCARLVRLPQCYVPSWYYANGSFVGPFCNARYCSVYAVSVYHAYYDTGSRFYKVYHSVDANVYRRHTSQIAQRSAKYYHEHDYHRALAHDRLLKPSSPLRHTGQHDARGFVPRLGTWQGSRTCGTQEVSRACGEHGKAIANGKTATAAPASKPAPKSASANKLAKAETSKPTPRSAPASKPVAKLASAGKVARADAGKSAAKSAPASKSAAKSASAGKVAKADAGKSAAKSAPASKSAAKSASAGKVAKADAGKSAAKSAPASKSAAKQEKK